MEQNMAAVPKLIDSQAEDFYVNSKGMAIVYINGDLKLPGSARVESKTMPSDVKWSAIVGASSRWIVAGGRKGHLVLVTLSTKSLVRSSLTIKLTQNGYRPELHATLYCIKVAVVRRHCSLILAFGIDGCSHLISMNKSGQLILAQSIASILDTSVNYEDGGCKTTLSVAETNIEGRFIVSSYMQLNMIDFKFK